MKEGGFIPQEVSEKPTGEVTVEPAAKIEEVKFDNNKVRKENDADYWKTLQLDKSDGIFFDPKTGKRWGKVIKILHLVPEIKHKATIYKYAKNTESIPGPGGQTLFPVDEVLSALQPLRERSAVNKETGIFTDKGGVQFAPTSYFCDKYNISQALCETLAKGVKSIEEGRTKSGARAQLYGIDDFEEKNQEYLSRKVTDFETKIYTDEAGKKYSYMEYFITKWPDLEKGAFHRLTKGMVALPGRNKIGKCDLYDIEQVTEVVEKFLALPLSGSEIYIDEKEIKWAPQEYFKKTYNISGALFKRYTVGVSTIPARGRGKDGKIVLYNLIESLSGLEDFLKKDRSGEDGSYEDSAGVKWGTQTYFSSRYGISRNAFLKRITGGHTATIEDAIDHTGHSAPLYKIEDVISLLEERYFQRYSEEKEISIFKDKSGKLWGAVGYFMHKFGVERPTFNAYATNIKTSEGVTPHHTPLTLYPVEEMEKALKEFISSIVTDEKGVFTDKNGVSWAPISFFLNKFPDTTRAIIKKYAQLTSSIPRGQSRGASARLYKASELENFINQHLALYRVDENTGVYIHTDRTRWITATKLREMFGYSIFEQLSGQLSTLPGRQKGWETTLYNLTEAEEKLADFLKLPQIDETTGIYTDKNGEEWTTLAKLTELLKKVCRQKIEDNLIGVRSTQGRNSSGQEITLYNITEIKEKLADFLKLPQIDETTGIYTDENKERWATVAKLVELVRGVGRPRIESSLVGIKNIEGRDLSGAKNTLYNIAEVEERLAPYLAERQNWEEQEKRDGQLKKDLENFAQEAAEGQTKDAQEFQAVLRAVGSSRYLDILYKFRPGFRDLPMEYVKSVIADYLGDYLAVKTDFTLEDARVAAKFLPSDLTIQEGFYEAFKDRGLAFYFEQRRAGKKESEEIVYAYLNHLVEFFAHLKNKDLDDIIQKVILYYDSVFKDFHKPDKFIDKLTSDREFPDVNQRVNMKELSDKKRLLIADEMGLGKSASVIMAKEQLGVKTALVVAPSNVISTWQRYLSDNHEAGGYYKTGQAPRVLTLESPEDLAGLETGTFDFILISQERLSEEGYVEKLEKVDYDMLIGDEIHKLKSMGGARAPKLLQLTEKIKGDDKYLALLSGTPIPNKVRDLAMILKLLFPEKYKNHDNRKMAGEIIHGTFENLRSIFLPHMQMKDLREGVEMPRLEEQNIGVELTDLEKEVYEVLLEDDELKPQEKIQILRQFLLNPELIDSTPGLESAKIQSVSENLKWAFAESDKILLFVHDYVEGVMRGKKSILDKLDLPAGVEIRTIHGNDSNKKKERERVQKEFNTSNKKILLVVSGKTADVGVDYSGADRVYFYNEPWTEYQRRQELARAYRPGLKHDLKSETFIASGTIEEGIHEYIKQKYLAVEKLLRGLPITNFEQRTLEKDEKTEEPDLSVNPELAEYYFSSWDKMMKIFGYVKELGETDFRKFLNQYAKDYAGSYADLGSRSYQANANRISGTIIHELAKAGGVKPSELEILDLASGPEMLKKHVGEEYEKSITSLDLNEEHFVHSEKDRVEVGSYLATPYIDNSFDFVNLCLSWHYTNFAPSRGKFERLQELMETNRILKPGGKVIINLIYSLELKEPDKFKEAAEELGFKIVDDYSGEVVVGNQYRSRVITLEKVKKLDENLTPAKMNEQLGEEKREGLKFSPTKKGVKNSRRIVTEFELGGKKMPVNFNEGDRVVLAEEKELLDQGEKLKQQYKDVASIPAAEIINNNFVRIKIGEKYILFKKLQKGSGVVVIK